MESYTFELLLGAISFLNNMSFTHISVVHAYTFTLHFILLLHINVALKLVQLLLQIIARPMIFKILIEQWLILKK